MQKSVLSGVYAIFSTFALVGLANEGFVAGRDGVKVLALPNGSAEILALLKKGDPVLGVEKSGLYWKVKFGKQQMGFVSSLDVKKAPDVNEEKVNAHAKKIAENESASDNGARSRKANAVMGIRGLSTDGKLEDVGSTTPNFERINELEEYEVEVKEVNILQKEVQKESGSQ